MHRPCVLTLCDTAIPFFFGLYRSFQVSEALSAYHVGQATNRATVVQNHSTGSTRGRRSQEALGGLGAKVPASKLCALALTFVDSAHKLVVRFSEENLMEAAHRVSASSANDVQAINTIVGETLLVVNAIRRGRGFHSIPGKCHNNHSAHDTGRGVEHRNDEKRELGSTRTQNFRSQRVLQDPKLLRTFLSSLARLYGALPDHHHHIWRSSRKLSTSAGTLGSAVEDLVHLSVIAWDDLSHSEMALPDANYDDLDGHHEGFHGGPSQQEDLTTEGCLNVFPWDPLLSLMSWGVVPVLTAENCLLSCIQAAANPEIGEERLGHHPPGCCWDEATSSRRGCLVAVVTAVAKGYHSLAVGEDLSKVLLTDLLGVAANSLTTVSAAASKSLFSYHPMDLCRLVARLTLT